MHRPILELLVRSCVSVAASVVLISSAGLTPANAAESFTPTMKDMLSIQGAIERYEKGMDTVDLQLQETAFWDDAIIISSRGKIPFMQALGGPTQPPGASRPPSCDSNFEKPATGWKLWHIIANSSYEFLSPTRVKHHAYWFAVCPSAGMANGAGIGTIGPPGSYNDILEKRNGEWRFIERNIALNVKYTD